MKLNNIIYFYENNVIVRFNDNIYYLKLNENLTYDEKEILNNIFEIYYKVHGNKKVDENCEIIK